jgi:hypothetical protein
LISVIPDSTCCFLRLEQFHNDNVTHVRATMVIYCNVLTIYATSSAFGSYPIIFPGNI